jgi:GNAT superfamily N-acetyltransferase
VTPRVRIGSVADVPAVLGLLDGAVRWLVEQGRPGQWGTEPWSASPEKVERIRGLVAAGELLLLEDSSGAVLAALVHGPDAMPYVPPAEGPEDYVQLLVADPAARGAGRRLLDESWARARAAGLDAQRVDCYAGGNGRLVRVYEDAGFTRTVAFDVGGWPGQVLERRA